MYLPIREQQRGTKDEGHVHDEISVTGKIAEPVGGEYHGLVASQLSQTTEQV